MRKVIAGVLVFCTLLSLTLTGCAGTAPEGTEATIGMETTSAAEGTAATAVETTAATTASTEPTAKPAEPATAPSTEPSTEPTTEPPTEPSTEPATEPSSEPTEAATESPSETEPAELLTQEQQNSINMLNYLTALVTEINASSSSRVYLESVYDELRNNTNPSVVDGTTRIEYENILDLLFNYRMIEVKRARLQYIYDQNKAAALRSAMPSPLSMMNVVQSGNSLKAVVSLLFMAMDAASSYASYTDEIEMQYLQASWALDDEEATNLHNSRKSMFSYMVRIVNTYGLPDELTLNEASVTELVKWKNHNNIDQRLLFLESNQQLYSAYGDYWLILAESYYLDGQYRKCLRAIEQYQALDNGIFRKDYKFANTIPYAVVAARSTMRGNAYVEFAEEYIGLLLDNTDQSNWAMRFFAAETYVELYGRTDNKGYLQKAYNVVLQTVNHLVEEQKKLNAEYLADFVEAEIPEDATSDEKKSIRKYNDYLEDARDTALPPVYEPLRLYCELLFALADEMDLSRSAKRNVDSILHGQGTLFLDANLDGMYWMAASNDIVEDEIEVTFDGARFTMPAQYVSAISSVAVTVGGQTITDWSVKEVNRNKSNDISDFAVTYTSEIAKDVKFNDGDEIVLEIIAFDDDTAETLSFEFVVEKTYLVKIPISTKFVRM